jgi:REP element-mobilizing transposase RayT
MSYNDLRKGRFSEPGRAYFITTVTHDRIPLFKDFHLARLLITTMKQLADERYVENLSWVIMPDHLHWLFQLGDRSSLASMIKRLKALSARSINLYLDTSGPVWQKSYYDRGLRDDEDSRQISRYIVANPLRAGLVENIGDYSHWDAVWL